MAVAFDSLDNTTKDQMACTFACLLLHDEGLEVNASNINKVLDNTGNKVTPYWPMLVSQALAGRNLGDLLTVSGGGNAPQAQNNAPVEAKKEEIKKRKKKRKKRKTKPADS